MIVVFEVTEWQKPVAAITRFQKDPLGTHAIHTPRVDANLKATAIATTPEEALQLNECFLEARLFELEGFETANIFAIAMTQFHDQRGGWCMRYDLEFWPLGWNQVPINPGTKLNLTIGELTSVAVAN